jgi:AcrR family transcriptional regulator
MIDAWLRLIDEGDLAPTGKGVAARAGIGLRTVFQHFGEMNELHWAAAETFFDRLAARTVFVPADLPFDERVETLVLNLTDAFEAMTAVRRACERQEWLSAEIHELIQRWEQTNADDTARVFRRELNAIPGEARVHRELAITSVLSWSMWNQMRERRGLTAEQARAVVVTALSTLINVCDRTPAMSSLQ